MTTHVKPHDLLKIKTSDFQENTDLPPWADASLKQAPYVVVRRCIHPQGLIGVGIRGVQRGERFALFLPESAVLNVIKPFYLKEEKNWKNHNKTDNFLPINSLKLITPVLNSIGLDWGPTGSSGFQLATGIISLNTNSDLDILIKVDEPLHQKFATELLTSLEHISPSRIDIQLDTPSGGVALKEYITSDTVMVKTENGPLLLPSSRLWY